jgi:hypothetical protein
LWLDLYYIHVATNQFSYFGCIPNLSGTMRKQTCFSFDMISLPTVCGVAEVPHSNYFASAVNAVPDLTIGGNHIGKRAAEPAWLRIYYLWSCAWLAAISSRM